MTIDSAIQNVGEYYAAHYLAEQFPKDIADQLKTWKGQSQPSQSPPRRLQALGDAYFRAKGQALDYADPTGRSAADGDLGDWHGRLLTALGYAAEPFWLELEGDRQVLPALLRLNRHGAPGLPCWRPRSASATGNWPRSPWTCPSGRRARPPHAICLLMIPAGRCSQATPLPALPGRGRGAVPRAPPSAPGGAEPNVVRPPSATPRQRGSLVARALHGASKRLLDHPSVTSAPTRLRLAGAGRLRFFLHTGQIGLATAKPCY